MPFFPVRWVAVPHTYLFPILPLFGSVRIYTVYYRQVAHYASN